MNENINLCEILKNIPKGTKFYTPLCGEVEFDIIMDFSHYPIRTTTNNNNYYFTKEGYYETKGTPECLLFPSKDQRDWSKYQRPFVNGDIITSKGGGIALFSHTQTHFECSDVVYYHCVFYPLKKFELGLNCGIGCVSDCRFATEEEKQKLFQAIKDNGYKWNAETKTLEKLITPNFKVGDIIQDTDSYKVKITNVDIDDQFYTYESLILKGLGTIAFIDQDDWESVEYQVGDHFINPNNNNEITKIIIPEADISYEIGYNNVYEIHESFKQVSNDCIKNIYVVNFKKGNQLGFVEISADIKGIIVYKKEK
jgi:hypothetical protein